MKKVGKMRRVWKESKERCVGRERKEERQRGGGTEQAWRKRKREKNGKREPYFLRIVRSRSIFNHLRIKNSIMKFAETTNSQILLKLQTK